MQKTMILDSYATTEKSITIFEHLPQETGYNFIEQKIEVTSESDKFLELLIKECSRYEIGYEQQGNTLIMVLPVRGYGPIHMILISKAKEAYMKKVEEEPTTQEEEAHMNTMVMEKEEVNTIVNKISKEELIENVKNYTMYSSSSTGVGSIYLKGNASFAKVSIQERLEEKFIKEFKDFIEEKDIVVFDYKDNNYFNDNLAFIEFEIELPGTKEEIMNQDSVIVAKKAVTSLLKEFMAYIKESEKKVIVNNDDDSNELKVSELKGLPLFFESKKPAIAWSEYDNGDCREYYVTKNGHKLYTSKATGSFFKTGQKAYKGQNILVVDLDTDKAGNSVGVQNLMSWARKTMGKDRLSEIMSGGVLTPSGGLHLYFTYPDDLKIKSNASSFLKHVDVRADSGIIVMPGTLAKSDKYEGTKEYILNDKFDKIKPIPQELLDLILSSQKPNYTPPVYSSSAVSLADTSMDRYRVEVWKSIVKALEAIVEGERNNILNAQAYKAGTHCIDEDLAYHEFARILGEKGMGSLEFETTFWKAYQEGRANPRKIEKIEERKNGDSNSMKNEDVNALAEKEAKEKKAREFEIASELRNLWEFEHQNVDSYYLKDKKVFIIWDEDNKIWVEQESPYVALVEYRRKRINQYNEEAREKGLNIYRSIASVETDHFLTGGTKAIKGYKNRVAVDLNSAETSILTENGILDLKTKTLSPMTKESLFTKKVNAAYLGTYEELSNNPEYFEAKEKFEKVIGNFGSKEIVSYMQGVLGSGLTTLPSHSTRSYWWYSNGGSGKTTILNVLKETFGEYSSKPTGSIFDANNTAFEMAKLEGSRVALIEEAPVGYLDAARMKGVLGSSTASLANKHEKSRDVKVTWGFHIMTNNLPLIRPEEFDYGTLRRITIIPFLKKHDGNADTTLVNAGKDPKVRDLCLAWLVDGCEKWLEDNNFEKDYNLPEEVLATTKKWQSRATGESDPLEIFIEENIEKNDEYYINANDFFSAYKEWCEENNVRLRDNALKTCNKLEEKLKVEFTPKARPQGKKNSHYALEYGNEFREDENSQKKRLFGFKFTTTK